MLSSLLLCTLGTAFAAHVYTFFCVIFIKVGMPEHAGTGWDYPRFCVKVTFFYQGLMLTQRHPVAGNLPIKDWLLEMA